jgi:hypothetical protein
MENRNRAAAEGTEPENAGRRETGTAGEGGGPGGQTGNRRKARRGTGGRALRPQTTRVRARGSGVACICDAAGRVPASLRELRIVVQQPSGGQQPTCQSRAPDAALPENAATCALCGLLIADRS